MSDRERGPADTDVVEKLSGELTRLKRKKTDLSWLEMRVRICFWINYTPDEGFVLESNHLALRCAPDPKRAERALLERGASQSQVEKADGQFWTFYQIPFAEDQHKAAEVAAELISHLYGVDSESLIELKRLS
jgi:hypothetical protein